MNVDEMGMANLSSVMFHDLAEDGKAGTRAATKAEMFALSDGPLRNHDYVDPGSLTPDEAVRPRTTPATFYSFDDGLACHATLGADWLEALGKTGAFFIHTLPLEQGYDVLICTNRFQAEEFPSLEDFYDAYETRARNRFPQSTGFAVPADFLSAYPFYSASDRRYRYLRDFVLDGEQHAEVVESLMRDRGTDWQDYAEPSMWLDRDQIRALRAAGHLIGLHTHSHPTNLARLSESQQYAEFARNKAVLEDMTGETVTAAAYPCGRYNADTLKVLKRLGVTLAFLSATSEAPSALELPRIDIAEFRQ